jgi:hypothetical protein
MAVKITIRGDGFVVTETAKRQARMLGMGGDLNARLRRMARRSAPLTHPAGNRRFDDFVLQLRDKVVESIDRL